MTAYLISCENATCAVPEAYRELFRGSEEVVMSPEGWEPGSLNLAQAFAMKFRTPLVHSDVTRLLIDFEKDGESRWSRFSIKLPEATRLRLADRHVQHYRTLLVQRIAEDLRRHATVLHVMVHTQPEADGRVILETPKGAVFAEKIAEAWTARLITFDLDVRHVRNAENHALGLALTASFPPEQYAQVRLIVSQTFFLNGRPWRWDTLKKLLLESLEQALGSMEPLIPLLKIHETENTERDAP